MSCGQRSCASTAARPTRRALAAGLLLAVAASGCATRFEQPAAGAAHATLALPSQSAQHDRGMYIEPVELNGVARPRNWQRESFRIPPGEFRLLARAAREAQQGTCLLQFEAVSGRTYLLDAQLADGTFVLAASDEGAIVAQCSAPATVLPTPARIPGVPSR